ncbi:pentapeptide repeat-containing protein [Latilactobacillus sakei]
MMTIKKAQAPILMAALEPYQENYFETDEAYENQLVTEMPLKEVTINMAYFKGSHFKDIQFEQMTFDNCDFQDVLFEHCALLNCSFIGNTFQRVAFDGCQLIGADFAEVWFAGCSLCCLQTGLCGFQPNPHAPCGF